MRDIGEVLRRTREEKGLTLHEAQVETKIRAKYLEALERGDESAVPGEVYYRGFLRSYANFLGLDGKELAERHRRLKEAQRAQVVSEQVRPSRRRKRAFLSPRAVTVLVVLFLLACFASWWAWQSELLFGGLRPAVPGAGPGPGPEPGPPPETGEGPSLPGSEAKESGVSLERISEPTGGIALLVRGAEHLEVKASFSGRCWVRVVVDDRGREEATFSRGEERTWTAQRTLSLRVGDAGALRLVANGREVGPLGSAGQVVSIAIRLVP